MPTAGCANAPGIVETLKSSGCEVHHTVLKSIQGETIRTNTTKYLEQYGLSQAITRILTGIR
ncbi:hypothetical protein [Nostoc sp.]|uniref:hypothetical protein n=1 Tax=Nostoc sp. TaxID=1180 RepID=UPI002FF73838